MIIAMCCTQNWYKYLMVDLYALLSTNKIRKIYLFVQDDDIEELKNFKNFKTKIIVKNYNKILDDYFEDNDNKNNKQYTSAALIRLLFPKIINEDKILYLDTDAIVNNDISTLWNIDMGNYYVAGVIEKNSRYIDYLDKIGIDYKKYINSGVLLMNLKKIREDKIDDKWLKLINSKSYRCPDQDVINITCKNRILFLDCKYNSSISTDIADDIYIMHYVDWKKNWIKEHFNNYIWYNWERRYDEYVENKDNDDYKIDVIIPLQNSSNNLVKTIESIVNQNIKDKVLITIVGNIDNQNKYLKYKEKINIKFLNPPKKANIAKLKEYALKNTMEPYFAFLNIGDEFYDEYSLERLYNLIHYNKAKASYGRALYKSEIITNKETLSGILYSRKHLTSNRIHFNSKDILGCDGNFNFDYFANINEEEIENLNNIVIKCNEKNRDIQGNLKYILKSKRLNKISDSTALEMMVDLFNLYKEHKLDSKDYPYINKIYRKIKNHIDKQIMYSEYSYLKRFINEISKY